MGLALILLVFAGAGFLLTCQKNPRGATHYAQRSPAVHATTVHHRNHHTKATVEQPAQTEAKVDGTASDSNSTSSPDATADAPKTDQAATDTSSDKTQPGIVLPHEKPAPNVSIRSQREVSRGSAQSTKIALTFDAGADARPASEILSVLAKHGVHATFFLTGKWIEKNPGLARRIIAQGHEIGNHTYSHKRLTELTSGEIADEVDRTEQLALEVTGQSTKPFFRPPYGARDKRVLSVVGGLGYRSIYWDLDCWDSVKKGITSAQIEDRVLAKIRNGSIVLMHCGSQPSADALDSLLQKLESSGYQQVTVSELLGN